MHRRRQGSGFGPNPLLPETMTAWLAAMGYRATPWEFETLCAIDDAYIDEQARRLEVTEKAPKKKPARAAAPDGRPLTRGRVAHGH